MLINTIIVSIYILELFEFSKWKDKDIIIFKMLGENDKI